jgi:hypothetical protein
MDPVLKKFEVMYTIPLTGKLILNANSEEHVREIIASQLTNAEAIEGIQVFTEEVGEFDNDLIVIDAIEEIDEKQEGTMKWIIQSDDGYWNNKIGWTNKELATIYSQEQREKYNLPVGENVKWVLMLDVELPTYDQLGEMTIEELRTEAERLGPYYDKRFNMDPKDYHKITFLCVSLFMMIENLEAGVDRWHRIRSN